MLLYTYINKKGKYMSKTKEYYTNEVEKQVDDITNQFVKGDISEDSAIEKLLKVDNLEMVMDKDNIGDHLYYAKYDNQGVN